MNHRRWYSDEFKSELGKLKRQDLGLFGRLTNKIERIMENPEHYARSKSRYRMRGTSLAYMGRFVIYLEVDGDLVKFYSVKHQDEVFGY